MGVLPAISTRSAFVSLATDVRVHAVQHGDAAGYPVLFLHGYSDSWFSFSPILPHLPGHWRAIAMDQRGHGDSGKPDDGYSIPGLAADAVALLDAMEIERASIVGHSMGSLVALQLALDWPDRVDRLALLGSAAHFRSQVIAELGEAVGGLSDPVPMDFVREFQTSTFHRAVPEAFLNRVVEESMKLPARIWRAAYEGMAQPDLTDRLKDIETPALIVRGQLDRVFDPAARHALESGLPNASVEIYADTGHAPHWERPTWTAMDLIEFVGI